MQEGCHFDYKSQIAFLKVLAPIRAESGLSTIISAADETNVATAVGGFKECEKAGNPDLVYEFSSTSKVTFSGSGLAAFAASDRNLKEYRKNV